MPSYKIRRPLIVTGGITAASGAIQALSGSVKIGASGTNLTCILFGTATASIPAITACSVAVTGSVSVPGAPLGATVFLTFLPNAAASPGGLMCYAAAVCTVGNVSASYYSLTHTANAACDMQLKYLVVG